MFFTFYSFIFYIGPIIFRTIALQYMYVVYKYNVKKWVQKFLAGEVQDQKCLESPFLYYDPNAL